MGEFELWASEKKPPPPPPPKREEVPAKRINEDRSRVRPDPAQDRKPSDRIEKKREQPVDWNEPKKH